MPHVLCMAYATACAGSRSLVSGARSTGPATCPRTLAHARSTLASPLALARSLNRPPARPTLALLFLPSVYVFCRTMVAAEGTPQPAPCRRRQRRAPTAVPPPPPPRPGPCPPADVTPPASSSSSSTGTATDAATPASSSSSSLSSFVSQRQGRARAGKVALPHPRVSPATATRRRRRRLKFTWARPPNVRTSSEPARRACGVPVLGSCFL